MTTRGRYWGTWLVLALFTAFLYFLGTIGFHHEGRPWHVFLVLLLFVIVLVLLAFRKLEPEDS